MHGSLSNSTLKVSVVTRYDFCLISKWFSIYSSDKSNDQVFTQSDFQFDFDKKKKKNPLTFSPHYYQQTVRMKIGHQPIWKRCFDSNLDFCVHTIQFLLKVHRMQNRFMWPVPLDTNKIALLLQFYISPICID